MSELVAEAQRKELHVTIFPSSTYPIRFHLDARRLAYRAKTTFRMQALWLSVVQDDRAFATLGNSIRITADLLDRFF
jgi:hypothetical protein